MLFLHNAFSRTDQDLSDSCDLAVSRRISSHTAQDFLPQPDGSRWAKVLDFVLIRVKFRPLVFSLPLNWNFHFGSCTRLTLKEWHTSAKVTGVEVPVLICQVLSAWERWMCLCKSLRVISSCLLHIVWKEFLFIFVWRIYLVRSLEGDYYFSLCKLCLVWLSLLLLSVSKAGIDLHSHLPLKQARLWSRASPRGMTHGSALL